MYMVISHVYIWILVVLVIHINLAACLSTLYTALPVKVSSSQYICDHILSIHVCVKYMKTEDMIADVLTTGNLYGESRIEC
jgi:hypothetical protein